MKIFSDTSPFIYLIENHPQYAGQLKEYFADLYANNDEINTSVVTYSEFCVKPEKEGEQELITEFEIFIEKFDIPLFEVKKYHAKKAYQLRAKYKFL